MIRSQFSLDLSAELIVDNFAGGGGASTGIELALGRHSDIAINHDPEAVAMHAENHPQTKHYCESVWNIDPVKVTGGRRVGLAWFSPDCKHFSRAKGAKPKDKKIRGLAWVVIHWINTVRPRVIVLENVGEFQTWCPLKNDTELNPWRENWFFRCFVGAMRRRGATSVEWRDLSAWDFGAPTRRKRLFLIARFDDKPVVWPEPTHADPDAAAVRTGFLKPWRTAAQCIDFSLRCPSIFLSKEQARLIGVKRPLAPATMRRIAKGIERFVINATHPFIIPLTHQGADRAYGMQQTLPTITAAHRGELALIRPISDQLIGPFITKYRPESCGSAANSPFPTVTANGKSLRPGGNPPLALVAAFMAQQNGGIKGHQTYGHPLPSPVSTISSKGCQQQLVVSRLSDDPGSLPEASSSAAPRFESESRNNHVRAFLTKYYSQGGQAQSLRKPMHTIPTVDRLGLVTVNGVDLEITDIGLRMLTPRELFRAQGFPDSYVIHRAGGRTLPKDAQVRMCGNSVCPPIAAALIRANVPELASWTARELHERKGTAA